MEICRQYTEIAWFMKSLLNITPVILFAVGLMELYRANMELKYNYEAFEWQMKNKTEQLDEINATLFRRAYQNVQPQVNADRPHAPEPSAPATPISATPPSPKAQSYR